jgi:nucleoside-diphosphate-sugar epimerase
MKILITGGSGFLGQRVARELLKRGHVDDAGGNPQPIHELVLVDIATPANGLVDPKVRYAIGDVASPKFIAETLGDDTEGIFHLAAVVSGAAEANFDLGMRVNVDGTAASSMRAAACKSLRVCSSPVQPQFSEYRYRRS